MKEKAVLFVVSILFWGFLLQEAEGGSVSKITPTSDYTLSSYTQRTISDDLLYLTNSGTQSDRVVFELPVLSSDKLYSLYLYSFDTSENTDLLISYLDATGVALQTQTSKTSFRRGWNSLTLDMLGGNITSVRQIIIEAQNIASVRFYALSQESGSECSNKFSAYLVPSSPSKTPDSSPPAPSYTISSKKNFFEIYKNTPRQSTAGKVLGVTNEKYFDHDSINRRLSTEPPIPDTKETSCTLHDYTEIPGKTSYLQCNLFPPTIYHISNSKVSDKYKVEVLSALDKTLRVAVHRHGCLRRNLLNPKTWFGCVDKVYKIYQIKRTVSAETYLSINNKRYSSTIEALRSKHANTIWIDKNLHQKDARLTARYYGLIRFHSQKTPLLLNQVSKYSTPHQIPGPEISNQKPFTFIFRNPVGVTQWFGQTAYNTRHTGIDFAVKKVDVRAPSQGKIISYKWDDFLGKCDSGGNILKIMHYDNLYTVYMHLDKSLKESGSAVQKGENVAISGATGSYKCKPLGYHLHFEVRKGPTQKLSTNPVPYIDVDWSKVHTIDSRNFPGRLTGNNPHPKF